MNRKENKKQHSIQFLLVVAGILILTVLSGNRFFRLDLTTENRYTLAPSTREILSSLDDVVYCKIYLAGELPSDFVRFQSAIREKLEDFRAYAGENLQYEFVNLYDEEDPELRRKIMGELYDKGLKVTNIQLRDEEGGQTEKIIFPGAMIAYRGVEFPVNLLKNNPSLPHQVNLNNSIQTLEYEFVRAIHSLTIDEIPRVAFIEGHGELDSLRTFSIMDELKNFFQVDRGYINGNLEALGAYEAIIIAQPVHRFDEADKFAIDQYIMRGGKVLWFMDPVKTRADSLSRGMTIALSNPVNVEDLLFKYGVRIDYNLVSDLQCSYVPVNTAVAGEEANFVMKPWVYYPLFGSGSDHPVTRGLNYVRGQFVTALDTVRGQPEGVDKTVILQTSEKSRRQSVPLRILVEEVSREPDPAEYNDGPQPVAVLLEGTFESFYGNYSVPDGVYPPDVEVVKKSEPTSILVAGDGDLIRNEVSINRGRPVPDPLGYEKYTRQTFGNLEFIMNAINYMTDDTGLMQLRSREFKLRLLNRELIKNRQASRMWKVINTVVPVLIVIFFGLLFNGYRRKKFSR